MKKTYEAVEMNIVMFSTCDVIVASAEEVYAPSMEDNETEIL